MLQHITSWSLKLLKQGPFSNDWSWEVVVSLQLVGCLGVPAGSLRDGTLAISCPVTDYDAVVAPWVPLLQGLQWIDMRFDMGMSGCAGGCTS